MKRILWILAALCGLMSTPVWAKGGAEHFADMCRILPFDKSNKANQKVFDLYERINLYLDAPNYPDSKRPEKPRFVKEDPRFSRMTFANHRIWYHWGFGFANAPHYTPLRHILEQNVLRGQVKESDLPAFWDKLKEETARRDRDIMNLTAEVFGYPPLGSVSARQREQLNAFATLLYCIHLIGDHTTTEVSVIQDLPGVVGELYTSISKLAGDRSAKNKRLAKKLRKQLQPYTRQPQALLEAMERYVPPFLLSLEGDVYNYRERFTSLGYTFR